MKRLILHNNGVSVFIEDDLIVVIKNGHSVSVVKGENFSNPELQVEVKYLLSDIIIVIIENEYWSVYNSSIPCLLN